ncbi:MAG: hypothetical protein ACREX8_11810, partial [Gammaproteobacteria bacterium]
MGFGLLRRWFLFGRSGLGFASLGGIGPAHAPTMRSSRRRETLSLFQALLPGAADLVSLGVGYVQEACPMSSKPVTPGRPSPSESDSHAWLFLPEELEELYSSPQPLEGDILLLNSKSMTGTASWFAQWGRFSHVGIVIGADLYIDAVSKQGIQVRRVADLVDPKNHYMIDDCLVLRSHTLVLRAPGIWSKALDYLERPYRLRGVFTKPDGTFDDRDPVVCSKL